MKVFQNTGTFRKPVAPTPVDVITTDDGWTEAEKREAEQRMEEAKRWEAECCARAKLYERALEALCAEHPKYGSNIRLWERWSLAERIWWIDQIEQQAKDGKDTIGARVVAQVVMNRLEQT